jgi:hypothetical protein
MQSIASGLRNKKLKKIIGVYQIEFVDFKASGLGDFIRGSFTMMQLVRLLNKYTPANLTYDLDFRNHPMSKWLVCDKGLEKPEFYSELTNMHIDTLMVKQDEADLGYQHLLREMIRFVNKSGGPTVHGFVCRDDVFEEILQSERDVIKSRMVPTPEMDAYVTDTLSEMGITGPYSVLHIRMADEKCFPPVPIDQSVIDALISAVNAKLGDEQYVLISNSDQVKDAFAGQSIHSKRRQSATLDRMTRRPCSRPRIRCWITLSCRVPRRSTPFRPMIGLDLVWSAARSIQFRIHLRKSPRIRRSRACISQWFNRRW